MSISSTNAFLYPSQQSTTNHLAQSQRYRLLKSSRKLEAVLGTTPFVLEVDVGPSFFDLDTQSPASSSTSTVDSTHPPITPRTRAHRRHGRVFDPTDSSSSFSSSDDDDELKIVEDGDVSEASYVLVSSGTPEGAYQTQSIPAAVTRHRSKSEANKKSLKPTYNKAKPLPYSPIHLDLPLARSKKSKGPQQLAQPMLLRLRSVPNPFHSHSMSNSINAAEPLSPLSSVFNVSSTEEVKEAKDKEMRRKKLAKLARTLGENVPPELVFPTSASAATPGMAPSSSSSAVLRKTSISRPKGARVQRKSSVSGSGKVLRSPSNGTVNVFAPIPAIPQASPLSSKSNVHTKGSPSQSLPSALKRTRPRSLSAPLAFPVIPPTPTSESSTESQVVMEPEHTRIQTRSAPVHTHAHTHIRAHTEVQTISYRPRVGASLDSPRAAAVFPNFVPAAASASLDVTYNPRGAASLDLVRKRSPVDYVYGVSSASGAVEQRAFDIDDAGWGKRKEREWSGEWNMRDMGDVVKKLRELKGR